MAPGQQKPGRPPGAAGPASVTLVDDSVTWMPGGPLSAWAPTFGPRRRQVTTGGRPVRVAVTRAEVASGDRSVVEWRRWQSRFVQAPGRTTAAGTAMWWRLAVHQRIFALCAVPLPDIDTTVAELHRIVRAADRLTVSFAHSPGLAVPSWVVVDGETPLLIGLPDYPLVGVGDADDSLVAMLRSSQFQRYVHDIHGRGPQRARVAIARQLADLPLGVEGGPVGTINIKDDLSAVVDQ
ncbi:hypothetical protein [Nocardioides sp. W7]|uniref:hypothetical protein n=1 Tax=Nocardioides sp. W7 TaxID=2931390 RepID=UPI001FD31C64|nr:hypothetical protein [Nocardioides sp. W7]